MVHDSFSGWVEAQVLPLQRSHPARHRLDGWDAGGNREVVGRFRHVGRVWAVHGDTRIRPVMAAYQAVTGAVASDPFNVGQTRSGLCLTLKPELWDTSLPKHFYVYSQTP